MNALSLTNLLVGKNASGKTRAINALQNVAGFLRSTSVAFGSPNLRTTLEFADPKAEGWRMEYSFEIAERKVIYEHLAVNGKTLVNRKSDKAVVYNEIINPPFEKLVVQVRRDLNAYPEIEKLMLWAEGVTVITCSDINPYTIFNNRSNFINPLPFSELVGMLGTQDKKRVIENAKRLGYDIIDMASVQANGDVRLVAVKERHITKPILDFQLSSGMIRVLYLLCFLELVKHRRNQSLLLIDDLGEGLDYQRATLLGKKVFEVCESEGMQMIASSNESFLMDVVEISKWQILRRKNSKLTVLNQANSPELFSYFRMTGLSNFDLFSSDFIDTFLERRTK